MTPYEEFNALVATNNLVLKQELERLAVIEQSIRSAIATSEQEAEELALRLSALYREHVEVNRRTVLAKAILEGRREMS